MARTHLFLAMGYYAFGEVMLGIRVARALAERGDRVLFLAPSTQAVLFKGEPFRYGQIDRIWDRIDAGVADVVAAEKCDDVVLIDAASVLLSLHATDAAQRFLARMTVPLIALDVWNLEAAGHQWDIMGGGVWRIPAEVLQLERRLVPVPFAGLAARGGYDALPAVAPDRDRRRARAELGLGAQEKLVVTTTATWQTARAQPTERGRQIVTAMERLMLRRLDALGERVRVIHVGPEPLAGEPPSRYRWIARLPSKEFLALLDAADLMVTMNLPATTVVSAVAHRVPTLVAINSCAGTLEDVAAQAGEPPGADSAELLRRFAPVTRFAAWPLGLYDFLRPVFADNPYRTTFETVEIFAERAFAGACERLLFDAAAADAMRERQAAYCAAVHRLPSATEQFDACLR